MLGAGFHWITPHQTPASLLLSEAQRPAESLNLSSCVSTVQQAAAGLRCGPSPPDGLLRWSLAAERLRRRSSSSLGFFERCLVSLRLRRCCFSASLLLSEAQRPAESLNLSSCFSSFVWHPLIHHLTLPPTRIDLLEINQLTVMNFKHYN